MNRIKNPKRQISGKKAKEKGRQFEERLDAAFEYYRQNGTAIVEKTPEPMRVTKNIGNGKFIAYFQKKAQTDYKGTIKGGQTVIFEAKYTETDRMEQIRVLPNQVEYMDRHSKIGTLCYVLAGFSSGDVYRVPWEVWSNMKEHFGRKYVTEADLEKYQVQAERNGIILIFG